MVDTNGIVQDVLLAGIAAIKVVQHFGVLKPLASKVGKLLEFANKHQSGVSETVETAQQMAAALITDNAAERDARIKAAAYTALTRLNTAVGNLTDQDRAAITRYVRDVVPVDMKIYVTGETIDSTLKVIELEIAAAMNHKALTTALDAKELLGPLLRTTAESETPAQTQQESSVATPNTQATQEAPTTGAGA